MPRTSWRPPPNWPTPPEGWTPPPEWQPDPAWGPAPPGWSFWQDAEQATAPDPTIGTDDEGFDLVLGHHAARKWRKTEPALRACLEPGERVSGFFLANSLRPLTDYVALTPTRLIAGTTSDLTRTPPRLRSVRLADVAGITSDPAPVSRQPKLSVRRHDGQQELLGHLLKSEDEALLRATIDVPHLREDVAPTANLSPAEAPDRQPHRPASPSSPSPSPRVPQPSPPPQPESPRMEQEARIQRLLDESVIDEHQAFYLRSVLFS